VRALRPTQSAKNSIKRQAVLNTDLRKGKKLRKSNQDEYQELAEKR
jgi:hypothetical protein